MRAAAGDPERRAADKGGGRWEFVGPVGLSRPGRPKQTGDREAAGNEDGGGAPGARSPIGKRVSGKEGGTYFEPTKVRSKYCCPLASSLSIVAHRKKARAGGKHSGSADEEGGDGGFDLGGE